MRQSFVVCGLEKKLLQTYFAAATFMVSFCNSVFFLLDADCPMQKSALGSKSALFVDILRDDDVAMESQDVFNDDLPDVDRSFQLDFPDGSHDVKDPFLRDE